MGCEITFFFNSKSCEFSYTGHAYISLNIPESTPPVLAPSPVQHFILPLKAEQSLLPHGAVLSAVILNPEI